jgi:hypothetical protein
MTPKKKPPKLPKPPRKPYSVQGPLAVLTAAERRAMQSPRAGWRRSQKLEGLLRKRVAAWHRESPSAMPSESAIALGQVLSTCLALTATGAPERSWGRIIRALLRIIEEDAHRQRRRARGKLRTWGFFREVTR